MDQLSEASGPRILTARHISAEKAMLEENNAVNTTLLCHTYSTQPHFGSYFEGKYNIIPISVNWKFSKTIPRLLKHTYTFLEFCQFIY